MEAKRHYYFHLEWKLIRYFSRIVTSYNKDDRTKKRVIGPLYFTYLNNVCIEDALRVRVGEGQGQGEGHSQGDGEGKG